jgi:hypothetical protein
MLHVCTTLSIWHLAFLVAEFVPEMLAEWSGYANISFAAMRDREDVPSPIKSYRPGAPSVLRFDGSAKNRKDAPNQ